MSLALIALGFLVIIFVIPNAAATIEFSERAGKETNDTTINSAGSDKTDDLQPEEQSRDLTSPSPSTDSSIMDTESLSPSEENYCDADLINENTYQGYTIKAGTNNADLLSGTPNKDLILGLDGDDQIVGLGEGDIICGGKGNDELYGDLGYKMKVPRPGKDIIFGQEGNDLIRGGPGSDSLQGDSGDDLFWGNEGNDYILAGDGNDKATGSDGNDIVQGSNGNDELYGGTGDDKLYGGNGDDVLVDFDQYSNVDYGDDLLDGGPGINDSCYDGGEKTFQNCEFVHSSIPK